MDSSKPYQEKLIVSLHLVTGKKLFIRSQNDITTNYEIIRAIVTVVLSMKTDITILQL